MGKKVGVIGGGAWGTALAMTSFNAKNSVNWWIRKKETVDVINSVHENIEYLPNIKIPAEINATHEITDLLSSDFLLLVAPAQFVRSVVEPLKKYNKAIVICCKGIEVKTGKLISEVISETMPDAKSAILAGPQFAKEVALKLPTATTLACADHDLGEELIQSIGTISFRPYYSDDVVGVQLCGALKNVIAIGAGMVEGANLGENAKAALITRGMAEIVRLGKKIGAKSETFLGLSGIGDLMLTANSKSSRNYSVGFELGKGTTIEDILKSKKTVSEGVTTTKATIFLAKKHGIEMPISCAINNIIDGTSDLKNTLNKLMSRPFKQENL